MFPCSGVEGTSDDFEGAKPLNETRGSNWLLIDPAEQVVWLERDREVYGSP